MTLDDLRQEYLRDGIGPTMLEEVREAVHGMIRRYDPTIYGGAASWTDAEEDIVQAVVLDVLLADGQLDYLMATSGTIEDMRKLLRFQVKRYLAKQRRRSVVDNLLDRAKEQLDGPPYSVVAAGPPVRYALAANHLDPREPTEVELLTAARAVALVPRSRPSGRERAPTVYTREGLDAVLLAVAISLPTGFSLSDLGRILEQVLTDWVASFLYDFEEAHSVGTTVLGPEDEAMSKTVAQEVLERFSDEQLLILRRKLEDVPDEQIARELGVSRPTVHTRKQATWATLQEILGDLPEDVQVAAMDALSLHLATLSGAVSHG